jgi:hypothetical protein
MIMVICNYEIDRNWRDYIYIGSDIGEIYFGEGNFSKWWMISIYSLLGYFIIIKILLLINIMRIVWRNSSNPLQMINKNYQKK